ncbi:phytanoyl-CoA dioxygenase family protein [Sulfurimonas marina]|uniref:phytanoyl-CoA dioxygenase family protein n=1 Tax=Sulfurimonas marina TaxID=2590551 RepID=UPI001D041724|nr:phytanoyl-CoA dioxygenase family protein [Sulfurimonas marina]
MKDNFYGKLTQIECNSDIDLYVEEIKNDGFAIIENVLTQEELNIYREKIDVVYKQQEIDFGLDKLNSIKEKNMCRMPLKYDDYFINIVTNKTVLDVVRKFLGDFFILNLQNAIINIPNEEHHQSSWHRDLPYQNYVISNPLSINALFCIDDFSIETGGTIVVPYTHKTEVLPSDKYIEKHAVTAVAKAGSVIVFDSMLFHKAGYNSSNNIRRAVNQQYQIPLLKQFYNFPKALNGKFSKDKFLAQLLGYTSQVPLDDIEWRNERIKRMSK